MKERKGGRTQQRADLLSFSVSGGDHRHDAFGSAGDAAPSRAPRKERRPAAPPAHATGTAGYVLRNFRLGVGSRSAGRLAQHVRAGDAMVAWEHVEQVVTWGAFEEHRCPICLDAPRAARITECGHTFCLACFMQYRLQMREAKKPCLCPLCQARMELKGLKLVSITPTRAHGEGDDLIFTLVRRWRGGVLSFAGGDPVLRSNDPPPALAQSARFSRYFLLGDAEVADLLQRDLADLDAALAEAVADDDNLQQLAVAEAREEVERRCAALEAAGEGGGGGAAAAAGGGGCDREHPTGQINLAYQAADGQHYFLSPFCMKVLTQNVAALLGCEGDEAAAELPYEAFPQELECRVERVEWHTADEPTLRRFKSAAALPHGTQFAVVDVALEGLVAPAVLERFAAEIAARRARRQEELRRERAEERRQVLHRRREAEARRARRGGELDHATGGLVEYVAYDPAVDGPPPSVDDLEAFPQLPGSAAPAAAAAAARGGEEEEEEEESGGSTDLPREAFSSPVDVVARRIDPSDGRAYTRDEFIAFYGDASLWQGAVETTPLVRTATLQQIQEEQRREKPKPKPKAGCPWAKPAAAGPSEAAASDPVRDLVQSSEPAAGGGRKAGKKKKGVKISLNTGMVVR